MSRIYPTSHEAKIGDKVGLVWCAVKKQAQNLLLSHRHSSSRVPQAISNQSIHLLDEELDAVWEEKILWNMSY